MPKTSFSFQKNNVIRIPLFVRTAICAYLLLTFFNPHSNIFSAYSIDIPLYRGLVPDTYGEVGFLGFTWQILTEKPTSPPLWSQWGCDCQLCNPLSVHNNIRPETIREFDIINRLNNFHWVVVLWNIYSANLPISHEENTLPKSRPLVRSGERKREAAKMEKKNIILEIILPSKFQVQVTQFKAVNRAMLM